MRPLALLSSGLLLGLALGPALGLAGLATSGTAAAQTPVRVLVAPLSSLSEQAGKLGPLETLLTGAVGEIPGRVAVTPAELRQALTAAAQPQPACEGEATCLAGLGRAVGATSVVAGEVGGLADGVVIYLKVVDVASGRETGSTVLSVGTDEEATRREARAAAFRLLAPDSYAGTLELAIDVPGATIYVDGARVARSPARPLKVTVGTHALRVTHERYRDYLRFVDVAFDQTTRLEIELKQFPIVGDDLKGLPDGKAPARVAPLPWYRRGWAVAGVGVLAASAGAAAGYFLFADGLDVDRVVDVRR